MLPYLGVVFGPVRGRHAAMFAAAAAQFTHTGVGPLAAEKTGVDSAGEDPKTLPFPCSAAATISQVAWTGPHKSRAQMGW